MFTLPYKSIKYRVLSIKRTIDSIPNTSQQGIASLALIALIIIGIATGTYLLQNRTNFLPQAADDVIRIKYSYSCDAPGGFRTLSITQGTTSLYFSDKVICNEAASVNRPCSDKSKSVCGSKGMQCQRDSDYDAHCVARKEQPSGTIFPCTLEQAKSNSLSNCPAEGQKLLISHCDFPGDPSNKIIGNEDCLNITSATQRNHYCYWNKQCSTGQQPAANPAQSLSSATNPGVVGDCPTNRQLTCPAGESCKVDHVDTRWCTANKPDGESCGAGCIYIGGLKRVIYPENTPDNGCNSVDKPLCTDANNEECAIFTKKINDKDYKYSACRKKSGTPAQPAAAQPRAAAPAGAGAPAAAAPASSTKTPWDNDADNNRSLKNIEVLKAAAQATSGSTDNASDAIDSARKARAAYLKGFDEGYAKVYTGKSITNDADARKERDIQANFVAIHAYIAKEFPGMSWEEAKQKGHDKRALDNLRRAETGWVIPQNATVDLAQIKAPNAVPTAGTPAAPVRRVIDPNTAVNCGVDLDGTNIPCYQIGVFQNVDDLNATQAQASIATQRYAKSQDILTAARGKVDDALLDRAQAKLDAAKAKAAACMPK